MGGCLIRNDTPRSSIFTKISGSAQKCALIPAFGRLSGLEEAAIRGCQPITSQALTSQGTNPTMLWSSPCSLFLRQVIVSIKNTTWFSREHLAVPSVTLEEPSRQRDVAAELAELGMELRDPSRLRSEPGHKAITRPRCQSALVDHH